MPTALAPALFDRFGKGIELGYTGEDLKKAYDLYGKLDPNTQLLDIAAAAGAFSRPGLAWVGTK